MEQIEELVKQIDKLRKKIWSADEINMQEIGVFVQSMYPCLVDLLPTIGDERADREIGSVFLNGINHVMEGLEYKDKMLLADALYYEIGSTLKLFLKDGV